MESLPPIRTPLSVYWREFRVQLVPVFFFAGILAAIAFLWRETGMDSTLSGLGEGKRHLVTSSQSALVEDLLVKPFDVVEAGQPLAVLRWSDPRARLDLLRAEMDLAQMGQQPSVAQENAMNFERLRMEWWRTKSELAVARVNLERSESEARRYEPLFREQLISEDAYDLSVATRDALRAEVAQKSEAVEDIRRRLAALESIGVPPVAATNVPSNQVLETLRTRLENHGEDTVLVAPAAGMVQSIFRHAGEHVVEGEPILVVNSLWSERIVGYLRQPYPVDPQVGLPVEVSTRDRTRREFNSEIIKVGAQVEIITNALAYLRPGALVDAGLPIVIALPEGIRIRPGELVDVRVRSARSSADASRAAPTPSSRTGPAWPVSQPGMNEMQPNERTSILETQL